MIDATDAWPAMREARAWVLARVALDERSVVMLHEARRRRPDARVVLADVAQLSLRDGVADLVRIERVLQWAADPGTALLELRRVVAPGGSLAVTDTDWGTFAVDHPDPAAAARLSDAALIWVPHARVARDLPSTLTAVGAADVQTRYDTVTITAWDPDDPAQRDWPPGLALRSIAGAHAADVAAVADAARASAFHASVVIVTCVARS